MKKPPFKQLRGTPAHALRHRITLGITLGTFAFSFVIGTGSAYLFSDKIDRKLNNLKHPLELIEKKKLEPLVETEAGIDL